MKALLPAIILTAILSLLTVAPTVDTPNPTGRALESAAADAPDLAAVEFIARAFAAPDASTPPDATVPFEITEVRERCDHYDPNRLPFFGTTHLHTGLSFDASIRFVDYASGNNPRGAYRFAKGLASIKLPDPLGFQGPDPLRNPRIDRPTDWGAVTDHSEHFGEMGICKNFLGKDAPGVLSMECRMLNGFYYQPGTSPSNVLNRGLASDAFAQLTMMSLGPNSRNTRLPLCVNNPSECAASELAVWQEMQMAAEEEYDRSRNCTFTTFIGYENTSTPAGTNWHRNVIFRNDRVVKRPINALDMGVRTNDSPTTGGPDGVGVPPTWIGDVVPPDPDVFPVPPGTFVTHPLPQRFWNRLERDCAQGANVTDGAARRCDFITIPHNSNLGGGVAVVPPLFLDPFNKEDARRHARFEPLVEIYQDKGSSECRWDPRFKSGVETRDEFCSFEILDTTSLSSASGVGGGGGGGAVPPGDFNDRAFVRNVWKEGLRQAQEQWEGINPFKMGVVASSDSHTGVMGWHPENQDWPGHLGIDDAWPMERPSTIQNSSGGHSVVWAEENSRDAIFEALKRKETYGTSGTRPIVRFFGGWNFAKNVCGTNFVPTGYAEGVPMGGDLPPRPNRSASPRFIVAAWKDDFIGTNLEQIQIVKGWVTAKGETKEKVYRVAGEAGNPDPTNGVDQRTCQTKPGGAERLCQMWSDPDFNANERAFYYARVLEKPVCRYSTLWCRERIGVDPLKINQCRKDLDRMASSSDPLLQANADRGASCCSNETTFPFVQPVIQERAWTSPIWYSPDS
jgi:hypothetical protein